MQKCTHKNINKNMLSMLKREDVKQFMIPLIDILLDKCSPYLWGLFFLLSLNIITTTVLLFLLYKKYFLC
uniref:Uncharacterized protein n=1 Tax=viral metagenome TaxID=1070528 RepID=A0A6C0HYQ3_9ZZZZ